ncbi:MAG TPA: 2-amino-4-hydroxy-6-hydroxymethyldihydropteridine diphosphokinase [Cryomorphaceae bacterium]|nr:2-amino-4-hydroxy-6-hydroxymethyldihydropteridine diphosphokinase [Cryomorphaceae bacterium]
MVSVISAAIVAKKVVKNDFMYIGIILIGTNLGDKYGNLELARKELQEHLNIPRAGAIYQTPPWGYESSEDYLNQALEFKTKRNPEAVMNLCLATEKSMGRVRSGNGYADRPIDIDILAIDGVTSNTELLEVPHPRLHLRKFALMPLAELWPDWKHPLLHLTVEQLLEQCTDPVDPVIILQ